VGDRAVDPDDGAQVVGGEVVFFQQESQGLHALDRLRLWDVFAFVILYELGHDREIVVLVVVQLVAGERVDDLHGVVVGHLVVDRTRQVQGYKTGVGLGQTGKGGRGGFHSMFFQVSLSYSAWVRNRSVKTSWRL